MLTAQAHEALSKLHAALADAPELERPLRARWRPRLPHAPTEALARELPPDLGEAADRLGDELPAETREPTDRIALAELLAGDAGSVLFRWCAATAWRGDVELAPVLALAAQRPALRVDVANAARHRVVEGPLLDALACAPYLGDGAAIAEPINAEARARLEILLWEAGASAVEIPGLGGWLWGSPSTFDAMIRGPAHGALRGRVLASRCLEVSASGMPPTTHPQLVGETLQVLQPLLLHPEPLVWIHAARALGRLTGQLEQLEGMLLDWSLGESRLLRQRAVTAFACLPGERLAFLSSQLVAILDSPAE